MGITNKDTQMKPEYSWFTRLPKDLRKEIVDFARATGQSWEAVLEGCRWGRVSLPAFDKYKAMKGK